MIVHSANTVIYAAQLIMRALNLCKFSNKYLVSGGRLYACIYAKVTYNGTTPMVI